MFLCLNELTCQDLLKELLKTVIVVIMPRFWRYISGRMRYKAMRYVDSEKARELEIMQEEIEKKHKELKRLQDNK